MNYTNLADSPHLTSKALKLIERSFGYNDSNSFNIDFYPLFNKNNFKNCHVIEKDDEVLAHIGLKFRKVGNFPIVMLGGIAVAEVARGKGLFKSFLSQLMDNIPPVAFFLLWSNKLELYKKLGFFPAGTLYEYPKIQSSSKFEIEEISWSQFKYENLYTNKIELRVDRLPSNWNEVKKITSAKVFLVKDKGRIINYFVMNKGADLNGIIHEYGHIDKIQLSCLQNFGKVWSPLKLKEANILYGTVIRPGSQKLFADFVGSVFGLEITNLDLNNISFKFESKEITLPIKDFLIGTFGPSQFSELSSTPPLFISGLDSI